MAALKANGCHHSVLFQDESLCFAPPYVHVKGATSRFLFLKKQPLPELLDSKSRKHGFVMKIGLGSGDALLFASSQDPFVFCRRQQIGM